MGGPCGHGNNFKPSSGTCSEVRPPHLISLRCSMQAATSSRAYPLNQALTAGQTNTHAVISKCHSTLHAITTRHTHTTTPNTTNALQYPHATPPAHGNNYTVHHHTPHQLHTHHRTTITTYSGRCTTTEKTTLWSHYKSLLGNV